MKCDSCGGEARDPGLDAAGTVICVDCVRESRQKETMRAMDEHNLTQLVQRMRKRQATNERLAKISEGLQVTFDLFAKDYAQLMDYSGGDDKRAAARLAGAMAGLAASQVAIEMVRIAQKASEES